MERPGTRFLTLSPAALAIALLVAGAGAEFGFAPAAGAQTAKVTVLSTASVDGETITCGCQKKELGGLARRAAVIKAERAKNPATLLVDAGDFGSHSDFEPWMRTEFQVRMMAELGYDVVTPGPNEMVFGVSRLQELMRGAPGIRMVSANVTDKSGNLLWDEFTVVEKGGVTFAVTGVTDRAYYAFGLSRGKQKVDEFDFRDMRESLRRVIPEMRKQGQVTVVLLHTGSADAKRVLEGIEGIDVVIVGHAPVYKFAPEQVGTAVVVQAGERGQYLGRLELTLEGSRVIGHGGEAVALGDAVTPDPEMSAVVAGFNKKYDAIAPKPKTKTEETPGKES